MTNSSYAVGGVAPIQIYPAGLQEAVTLLNTGTETIYVTSINSSVNGYPLTAGNSYSWRKDTPLYAYTLNGVSSTLLVVETGDVLPMGAVGINGPVTAENSYAYLGQYQFNAPLSTLDLSGYSSLILVPVNLGIAGFDVQVSWGNNVNFYDVGDGAGWNGSSVAGVYITSVKATYAQFSVTNASGSNVSFNVYASANPIPATYYNSANPATLPFEAQRTYALAAIGAGAGAPLVQLSSKAGRAHVNVTVAAAPTNTNNGLIVEFNDGAGRVVDRHVMFDANPFASLTYDLILPRRALIMQVTNFTAVAQTPTISITYDT